MCQFIETIRETDGVPEALPFHQERMERTMRQFFPSTKVPNLADVLKLRLQAKGVCKCRVVYGARGIETVERQPYTVRQVRTLRLICDDAISYEYKSADRTLLNRLAALRAGCDDVIIVRHGLLTDTSYSNIALSDGTHWFTPRLPLLCGTMRQRLIEANLLTERDIRPEDLPHYQTLSLINAMLDLGRVVVGTDKIFRSRSV